jgi:hypothetical protein
MAEVAQKDKSQTYPIGTEISVTQEKIMIRRKAPI